jgi:uncharacterized integral membrane protein
MSNEDKAELLSWIVTAFVIIVGFLLFLGLMIFIEIKQEGVPDNTRFGYAIKLNQKEDGKG